MAPHQRADNQSGTFFLIPEPAFLNHNSADATFFRNTVKAKKCLTSRAKNKAMSESKKEREKTLQAIIKDLWASDEAIVLDAIKRARDEGDPSLIVPLLEMRATTESEKITDAIQNLLFDLSDNACLPPLIEALDDPKRRKIRSFILSIFWQSRLEATPYISTLTRIALEGNYMEALEVLTVVENLEGPFEEETLLEALILLRQYFGNADDQQEKHPLLLSLYEQIKQYDQYNIRQ